jgi:hypothetical protein
MDGRRAPRFASPGFSLKGKAVKVETRIRFVCDLVPALPYREESKVMTAAERREKARLCSEQRPWLAEGISRSAAKAIS